LYSTIDPIVTAAREAIREQYGEVRRLGAEEMLERAVGVEEGRLGDVLGVRRILQQRKRVAVDVLDIPAVETLERDVLMRERRERLLTHAA